MSEEEKVSAGNVFLFEARVMLTHVNNVNVPEMGHGQVLKDFTS